MSSSAAMNFGTILQRMRFTDQDELRSLIRGGASEFLQKKGGPFEGEFTFVGLDNGIIQFGQVGLPYISRGAPAADRPTFILHLKPQPEYVWKGQRLDPRSLVGVFAGGEHQDVTPPNSYWAIVSVDRIPMERALAAIAEGAPQLNSHGSQVFLPEPDSFDALCRRLKAVHSAVRADPTLLGVPQARRGIEESVLGALALALGSASPLRPATYSAAARTRIARQLEAYLSATTGESVCLADLCAVSGVGERTLRNIFQERYGLSPVQYLKLRRLHQARRALRRADPDLTTVQNIANRCGIWHLGRFAAEYKALFYEAPLDTLKSTGPIGRPGGAAEATPRPRRDSLLPGLH